MLIKKIYIYLLSLTFRKTRPTRKTNIQIENCLTNHSSKYVLKASIGKDQ